MLFTVYCCRLLKYLITNQDLTKSLFFVVVFFSAQLNGSILLVLGSPLNLKESGFVPGVKKKGRRNKKAFGVNSKGSQGETEHLLS